MLGCSTTQARTGQKWNAENIFESCEHQGSVITAKKLTSNDQEGWIEAADQVATGADEWIKIVPCMIRDMYDTGSVSASAILHIALAQALPKNPAAILALEGKYISIKEVCSLPFYEVEVSFIEAYVNETSAILASLESDEYLRDDARICALRLNLAVEKMKKLGILEAQP